MSNPVIQTTENKTIHMAEIVSATPYLPEPETLIVLVDSTGNPQEMSEHFVNAVEYYSLLEAGN